MPETTKRTTNSQLAFASRTSLTPEEEQILCNWVRNQVEQGRTLTKTDLMKHAKLINSHNSAFHASTGWCRRFLMRNDDARIMIESIKPLSDEQRRLIDKAQLKRLHRHERYETMKMSKIKQE